MRRGFATALVALVLVAAAGVVVSGDGVALANPLPVVNPLDGPDGLTPLETEEMPGIPGGGLSSPGGGGRDAPGSEQANQGANAALSDPARPTPQGVPALGHQDERAPFPESPVREMSWAVLKALFRF